MTESDADKIPENNANRKFNQDERLRSIDEAHQRFLTDVVSDRAEAREEGKIEGITVIVRNMKLKGFSTGDIAEMTGLSYTEVERLI